MSERVSCETCNERVPQDRVRFKSVPGATLAFCERCREPPLEHQNLGPGGWPP